MSKRRYLENNGRTDEPPVWYNLNKNDVQDNTRVDIKTVKQPIINQPEIKQTTISRSTQNKINKQIQKQKVLEPINKVLDVAEYIPIIGDAINVGRAASDALYNDYNRAIFLPLSFIGNKIGAKSVLQKVVKGNKHSLKTIPSVYTANDVANFSNKLTTVNNDIKLLPRYSSESNKEFIEKANKYFYNYEPLPINQNTINDERITEKLVKDRIAQHNTFYRGVRDPETSPIKEHKELAKELNKKLIQEGLEPTRENRLIYAATHHSPETGSGRAGFLGLDNTGTLYASNSLSTGAGYAKSRDGKPVGEIAIVRRPYTLGNDRNMWFKEGDFNLRSNSRYNPQPASLRLKRSLKNFNLLNTNDLSKEELNKVYNDFYEAAYNEYDRHLKYIKELNREQLLPSSDIENMQRSIAPTNKERVFINNLYNYMLRTEGMPVPKRKIIIDPTKKQGYRLDRTDKTFIYDNPFEDNLHDFFTTDDVKLNPSSIRYLMKKSKATARDLKKEGFKLHNAIENTKINNGTTDYPIGDKFVNPNATPFIYTTEILRPTTLEDNKYQHYISVGPVDTKGFDFIGFVPRSEWIDINSTRMHVGESDPRISHKTFKSGGSIYIKPSHRGRFTALKERTGHSATWFKENGTPAQKKMAIFALNAAKWKH